MTERDKLYAAFQAGAIRHGGRSVTISAVERSFAQWYNKFKIATEPKTEQIVFGNKPRIVGHKKKP